MAIYEGKCHIQEEVRCHNQGRHPSSTHLGSNEAPQMSTYSCANDLSVNDHPYSAALNVTLP